MSLENFIKNNRGEFEEDLPSSIWRDLEQELSKPKKTGKSFNFFTVIKYAAAVLLFTGLGYLLGIKSNQKNQNLSFQSEDLSPILVFQKEIEEKKQDLSFLKVKNPELYSSFLNDFETLEKDYNYLKKQFANNPNHKLLLDAMIKNLQFQIELLSRQYKIAEKLKSEDLI
jgi:hypothetical protein